MSSRTPKPVLRKLEQRDGHVSAWTGEDCPELVPQHRQGGMGGRPDKHRLSNLVWLESIINGLIESDPVWQAEAVRRGIKISLHADPRLIPVEYPDGERYWLTDDGRKEPVGPDPDF